MGKLIIMNGQGDSERVWDDKDQASVLETVALFESLMKRGGLAFKIDQKTRVGEQIYSFDQYAEELVILPQISGGC
jgi:hypothetical protein